MRVLTFNSQATTAIHGRKGAKLRLDVKDGTLFMRPTDRKAGPHVLTELQAKGKSGVSIEVTDKQLEKLGASGILEDASTFGLRADKYGWFAMTKDTPAEGDTLFIEGAEVSIADKAEKAEPAKAE